jgi:hypothetical protein
MFPLEFVFGYELADIRALQPAPRCLAIALSRPVITLQQIFQRFRSTT